MQEVLAADVFDVWGFLYPSRVQQRLCGGSFDWRVTLRRVLGLAEALSALDDVGWLFCDFTYDQFACSANSAIMLVPTML